MFGIDEGKIELPHLLSGADLSSSQYLFGKLSAGTLVACDTLGEATIGVIYDNPAAAARGAKLRAAGIAEVTAGEALTADRYVTPGANGRAYHCIGTNLPAGRVILGCAAAGERALIKLVDPARITNSQILIAHSIDLANIADGNILTSYPMPFAGRVEAFRAVVEKVASTALKASTLNLQFGGTDATGGTIGLTTANMSTLGAIVASSAFTAGHTFAAGALLDIEASSTTAFVEGRVRVEVLISARS